MQKWSNEHQKILYEVKKVFTERLQKYYKR